MTALSAHFDSSEFEHEGVAVPPEFQPNVQQLATLEEAVRAAGGGYAIRNTSGYRTAAGNLLAGGVNDSQHLEAGAVDGVPQGVDLIEWARAVLASRDTLPAFGQFILESDGHFHLSIPRNNRGQVLVEVGRNSYAPWDGVSEPPAWGSLPRRVQS